MRTVCSCSLGQITHALYEVGGQCRRSMQASPSAAGGTSMDRHEP